MLYVGLDVHKNHITVCVLDSNGKLFQQRVQRGEPDRRKVSVIATSHYLVRVMWSMLKNVMVWQERTPAVLAT